MQKFISTISSAAIALTAMPYLSSDNVNAAVKGVDTVKIMCIGDSITDGYVPEYEGSYRKFIYHDLTEWGHKIDMVGSKGEGYTPTYTNADTGESFEFDNGNTGYSGYAIKAYPGRNGILETLKETKCLEEQKPDIITLQIGTNNIIDNHDMTENSKDLEELIEFILESTPETTAVFVTTIPDLDPNRKEVYDWFGNYRHSADWQTQYDDKTAEASVHKAVAEYNAVVQATVEKIKADHPNVYQADINGVVDDVKTLLFDGVHPNNDGYRAMGAYWSDTIASYLGNSTAENPEATTTTTAPATTTVKATTTTKPASTTTKTTATTTASTSKTTTTTKDPYIWDPDATTTTVSEEEFNRIRISDLIAFSRYLIGDNRLGFDERRLKLYDMDKNKKLDTFDLVLMRKELLQYGAKLREKFGEDYCVFEGGRDITIIDPDAEPEKVESSSSGSHSTYVALNTEIIDLDTMTDKEIVALYVEKNVPIYDKHRNVVKPEDIKYDENEYAYVINADGEKELLFRWLFETENVFS